MNFLLYQFDKDGSGNIEKQELERLLSALKIHIPNCTIRDLNDKYGNQIDFDEFKNVSLTLQCGHSNREHFKFFSNFFFRTFYCLIASQMEHWV